MRKQEYIVRSRELNKNSAKQTKDNNVPCSCHKTVQCPCNKNTQSYSGDNFRLFPSGNTRLYACSTLLERGMNPRRDTFNLLESPDDCRTDGRTTVQPQDVTAAELCSELKQQNQNEWHRTENGKNEF